MLNAGNLLLIIYEVAMGEPVEQRPPPRHLDRLALVGLVTVLLLLGSCGVGVLSAEGQRLQIGGYRVSYWRPPGNASVLLTMSSCEGTIRHVITYGLRHPRIWTRYRGATFLYYQYSSTDPNCPFS